MSTELQEAAHHPVYRRCVSSAGPRDALRLLQIGARSNRTAYGFVLGLVLLVVVLMVVMPKVNPAD